MTEYVIHLNDLKRNATASDPMPALDSIVRDLCATSTADCGSAKADTAILGDTNGPEVPSW
jgi:hypothetical protein